MNTRQFLDGLAGPSILTMDELAKVRRRLTPEQLDGTPDSVARELIRRGRLTRYQAIQVFQGFGDSLVFGEYLVLDKIGEGGMGRVYKASHRRMKRIVALKVLPANATNSQSLVDRFYKEVELAARLSHPNIVTAYDAGEARGLHYLVMEYIDGCTLSDHIKAHGPLPIDQAMNCVLQAGRGLDYAHSEGIIHRDIKPSNLMVNQRGVIKVLDLGLARIEHSLAVPLPAGGTELTSSGQVLGTVDYMAPEQSYDSRSADNRSDIYSLGCTLYRLLVGHPPFAGETLMQKLLAHREQPIPWLREKRPDVPPGLDLFYQRMVAKLPEHRPRSMREVVFSMESMLAGTSEAESTITHISAATATPEELESFLQRLAGGSIGAGGVSYSDTQLPSNSGTIRTGSASASRVWRKQSQFASAWLLVVATAVAAILGLGSWLASRPPGNVEEGNTSVGLSSEQPAKKKAPKEQDKLTKQPDAPRTRPHANWLIDDPSSPQLAKGRRNAPPDVRVPTPQRVEPTGVEPPKPTPEKQAVPAATDTVDVPPPNKKSPGDTLPQYRPVDLLAEVDLVRNRVSGAVRLDHGDVLLEATPEQAGSCISIPASHPTDYVLTALVERTGGQDNFLFALPTDDRQPIAGVDWLDGATLLLPMDDPFIRRPHMLFLPPWRLHRIVCTVRGGQLLRVEVDDQEVIRQELPMRQDPFGNSPKVADAPFLIRGSRDASFRIRRLDLALLTWQKVPQPGTDSLATAVEAIESTVAEARKLKRKGEDKSPAARKLRSEASRSTDPARCWALLDAAAQQAAADGDLDLTCHILADLSRTFDGHLAICCERHISAAFKATKTATARQALLLEALRQIDVALALEAFDLAQSLQSTALSIKSSLTEAQHELKARAIEIDLARAESASGWQALEELDNKPASSEAHLAAARYLAVVRGDWKTAATHFKEGGKAELAELAVGESSPNDNNDSSADLAVVGDRWWNVATEADTPLKWWYMERAVAWYRRALPNSTPKIKTAVESKMKLIAKQRKASGDAFRSRHPIDAVQISGRWYKYYPEPMPWRRAESVCRGLGGSLPIIKTVADNLAVMQMMTSIPSSGGTSDRRTVWLGCSDAVKEGDWRWLDGTSVGFPGFLNWRKGEPDNADDTHQLTGTNFATIQMVSEKGEISTTWTDERSAEKNNEFYGTFPFVCVWDD